MKKKRERRVEFHKFEGAESRKERIVQNQTPPHSPPTPKRQSKTNFAL